MLERGRASGSECGQGEIVLNNLINNDVGKAAENETSDEEHDLLERNVKKLSNNITMVDSKSLEDQEKSAQDVKMDEAKLEERG